MKTAPAGFDELAEMLRSRLTVDCNPSQAQRHPEDPWTDDDERRAILDVPYHGAMTFPEQLSQALAWPSNDLPALNRAANTTFNAAGWVVGPINMSRVYRALAKVTNGNGTGVGCTVVGAFFAGNTTNSLQAVTGAAWTWAQVTAGATINIANSAGVAVCTAEIRADQLPANTSWLMFVVNNQCACTFSVEVICAGGAYRPTFQYNCTSVLGQSIT